MGMRWPAKVEVIAITATVFLGFQSIAATSQPIAGLNPSQRPADAPVITTFVKTGAWYAYALRGVVPPYPMSLRFLESQGAWFNPFLHASMTGPYDIRGLHGQNAAPIVPVQ